MYSLYKREEKIRLFSYAFAAMLVLLGISAWVSVVKSRSIDFAGILGGLFFYGLAYVFYKMASANKNPYAGIDELRMRDPGLVEAIEREFEIAENVHDKIWFGPTYLYFHSTQFEVAPYNSVSGVRVFKSYSGKSSFYNIETLIDGRKVEVYFTKYGESRKIAVEAAKRIADLTGAPLTNELEN